MLEGNTTFDDEEMASSGETLGMCDMNTSVLASDHAANSRSSVFSRMDCFTRLIVTQGLKLQPAFFLGDVFSLKIIKWQLGIFF